MSLCVCGHTKNGHSLFGCQSMISDTIRCRCPSYRDRVALAEEGTQRNKERLADPARQALIEAFKTRRELLWFDDDMADLALQVLRHLPTKDRMVALGMRPARVWVEDK